MTPVNDDGVTADNSHAVQTAEIASLDSNTFVASDTPAPLQTLREQYENIPQQMRDAKRWLLRKEKVPYYLNGSPRRGILDSPEDQANFGIFDAALAALSNRSSEWGLGFALGPDGTGQHWQGIDFDHVSQHKYLDELKEDLPGYTERSPSGDGWHAVGYGQHIATMGSNGTGMEVYSAGRYFTVTGDCSGGSIEDLSGFVATRLRPMRKPQQIAPLGNAVVLQRRVQESATAEQIGDVRSALKFIPADSYDNWIAMGQALCKLPGGYEIWAEWSATSNKWQEDDGQAKWRTFTGDLTSYKAVFKKAQDEGWANPQSGSANLPAPSEPFLIDANEFSKEPPTISWIIRGWLPTESLSMVHGPSGSGKTFVVLDWCLRIAAGLPEWAGNKVRPGPVVYLAGEGHGGLKKRITAWKQNAGVDAVNMWISPAGCDLDTPDGYERVRAAINEIDKKPVLIVVDTLHRFLSGDENSPRDAKVMVDYCARLMKEFHCSVTIVHHTGVSEMAQNRARGSSAWKATLDMEISVIPGADGEPITIKQRKAKDDEPASDICVELVKVPIDGWFDEDGIQIWSAVLQTVDAPTKISKAESKLGKPLKTWENCWEHAGSVFEGDDPFLSYDGARAKLRAEGLAAITITHYLSPSRKDGFICKLLKAKKIKAENVGGEKGWFLIDPVTASAMRLLRKPADKERAAAEPSSEPKPEPKAKPPSKPPSKPKAKPKAKPKVRLKRAAS